MADSLGTAFFRTKNNPTRKVVMSLPLAFSTLLLVPSLQQIVIAAIRRPTRRVTTATPHRRCEATSTMGPLRAMTTKTNCRRMTIAQLATFCGEIDDLLLLLVRTKAEPSVEKVELSSSSSQRSSSLE